MFEATFAEDTSPFKIVIQTRPFNRSFYKISEMLISSRLFQVLLVCNALLLVSVSASLESPAKNATR